MLVLHIQRSRVRRRTPFRYTNKHRGRLLLAQINLLYSILEFVLLWPTKGFLRVSKIVQLCSLGEEKEGW